MPEQEQIMDNRITANTTNPFCLTESELCSWLGGAASGDALEYHRGVLALDRSPLASRLPKADQAELERVARRAFWAAEQGLAHLVQRRRGPDDYSYLMIARPRPKTQSGSLLAMLAEEVPQ